MDVLGNLFMSIYRNRIYTYLGAGFLAGILGFFPASYIAQIVQPAVGIWIISTSIMIFWAKATSSFRDPMQSILKIPVHVVGGSLAAIGVSLIAYGVAVHSVRAGMSGVLLICFSADAFLTKRESWLRHQAGPKGGNAQA